MQYDVCNWCHWFFPDWIIPLAYVDEYYASIHYVFNELICEHNWRMDELLWLPIGLRNYHKELINNRVQRKNDEMKK